MSADEAHIALSVAVSLLTVGCGIVGYFLRHLHGQFESHMKEVEEVGGPKALERHLEAFSRHVQEEEADRLKQTAQIARLDAQHDDKVARLGRIEDKVNHTESTIATLSGTVATLSANVGTLSANVSTLLMRARDPR